MKILFAGDLHGEIKTVHKIVYQALKEQCDLIFQLGDFGYWEHTPDGERYINRVAELTGEHQIPLYFLDGNHDKTSLLLQRYDHLDDQGFIELTETLKYSPRGHRWTWEGLRFVSFGGAYSVDKHWRLDLEKKKSEKIAKQNSYRTTEQQKSTDTSESLWFPEEEMTDIDMDNFLLSDSSPVDIMLAHDKPRSSNPSWNRKDFPECWPNQDRLQLAVRTLHPKLYLHGHLHYRYVDEILCGDNYKYTTVMGLNADGESGTTYVIDLTKTVMKH